MKKKEGSFKSYIHFKTRQNVFKRFLIVLFITIVYAIFAMWHYGLKDGILVSFLTWSSFVLCTPIADAGFLLDFPVRILTKIRMIYSEIFVWGVAISLNITTLIINPEIYNTNFLLTLFKTILTHPFPYWIIIFLSAAGTFLSIYFGDELLDVLSHDQREKHKKHKNKHRLIIFLFIIAAIILLYFYLLNSLHVRF